MKRKAPDYELYFENVSEPTLEHLESLLSLYFSYLQILNEMSDDLEQLLQNEEVKETYTY